MTTLSTSEMLVSGLSLPAAPRFAGLRDLFARMATAARADTARRSMGHMSEHMLRDLGLSRGDIEVLDL